MKLHHFILLLGLCTSLTARAENQKTKVSQVTNTVTLTTDVDYIITSTTPFTTTGSVNIESTEHAVVIIENIRPSKVISNWLGYIYINGEQAVNEVNCQVKMYSRGAIIFPYAQDFRPLTCYTEPNFGGESCDAYTEGSSGGFMKTLSASTLNNQIRSFRLKRGYMVTFALGTGGWGYSRCFIADQADLEFPTMPTNMDGRISSYRLFRWHNAHKAGLASNGSWNANQALKTSWCYDWAQGNANNMPDTEWVPNHIYEDYPSPATCGNVTASCHMKTNNEPKNQSDDHPQELETILNNWQNLMRTGMRLCSPSSWDGSDYWNGTGFIKTFLDSIDARGWRCDIVDAHGYWNKGNFDNLKNYWYPNMKRPIWISEWIWGASWSGGSGAFASGVTDAQILSTTKEILDNLNSMECVERYAYWNSESKAHIYENNSLTSLGQYYASMNPGLGYKKSLEFVPRVAYNTPKNLDAEYTKSKGSVTLRWNDDNGDMLDSMTVECKLPGSTKFVWMANVPLRDKSTANGAAYSFTYTPTESGAYYYRVAAYPIGSKTARYSGETAVSITASLGNDTIQYGKLTITNTEAVTTDFSTAFSTTPAVFMGICSNNNASLYPGNLVLGTTARKFNYQILPWSQQKNAATSLSESEDIPFMAIKEGHYKFGQLDCEVGIAKAKSDTATITFSQPFPEGVTPIILTEVRNPTSAKTYAHAINIWDVSSTGFKAIIRYEEGVSRSISVLLNLCYFAITPGQGSVINEQVSQEIISTDTVRIDTFRLASQQDSLVYTLRHTVQNTIAHTNILAGTGENNMFGSTYKACTFTVGEDTIHFRSPKVFGKCQTSNYPAAAVLRKQSDIRVSDRNSPFYNLYNGARIKRQVDGTSTTTVKNTSANSDVLGYVIIDNGENTLETEEVVETSYEIIDTGTPVISLDDIAGLIRQYITEGGTTLQQITGTISQFLGQ